MCLCDWTQATSGNDGREVIQIPPRRGLPNRDTTLMRTFSVGIRNEIIARVLRGSK